MPVTVICRYIPCGKVFDAKPYKAAIAPFCSRKCFEQWRTAQQLTTFWDKVKICAHGMDCCFCCWPWEGTTDNEYKNTTVSNKFVLVHRLAWELWNNRKLPRGKHAAHYCHWRSCANPDHIHEATAKENIADSTRDKRRPIGEQHANSKLTETKVLESFRLKMLEWSNQDIAKYLHVSTAAIDKVMGGRNWKHLPRPEGMPRFKPGWRPKPQSPQS